MPVKRVGDAGRPRTRREGDDRRLLRAAVGQRERIGTKAVDGIADAPRSAAGYAVALRQKLSVGGCDPASAARGRRTVDVPLPTTNDQTVQSVANVPSPQDTSVVSGTMKSMTSPTASAPWNRVSRMLVSGRYICFGCVVTWLDSEK